MITTRQGVIQHIQVGELPEVLLQEFVNRTLRVPPTAEPESG